jgi:catechol 2,3-dioxygenase
LSVTINELLQTGPARPEFDIVRAAYVELLVTDLQASRHFYVDQLGLIVSAEDDTTIYLRGWEERQHHSIVLRQADKAAAWASASWTRASSTRSRPS